MLNTSDWVYCMYTAKHLAIPRYYHLHILEQHNCNQNYSMEFIGGKNLNQSVNISVCLSIYKY